MSIFKTLWIVLQVGKYSEKELYYKVFFKDYGILTVKKKKKLREKPVDMGYLISCEIITHSEKSIHTIGNIKILSFYDTKEKPYSEIEAFMKFLSKIKKDIPEWNPHYEIFNILSEIISIQNSMTYIELLLAELKILAIFWNLPDTHIDITVQKILKFIHSHGIKDIFRLKWIPEDVAKSLEQML